MLRSSKCYVVISKTVKCNSVESLTHLLLFGFCFGLGLLFCLLCLGLFLGFFLLLESKGVVSSNQGKDRISSRIAISSNWAKYLGIEWVVYQPVLRQIQRQPILTSFCFFASASAAFFAFLDSSSSCDNCWKQNNKMLFVDACRSEW